VNTIWSFVGCRGARQVAVVELRSRPTLCVIALCNRPSPHHLIIIIIIITTLSSPTEFIELTTNTTSAIIGVKNFQRWQT